MHTEIVFQAHCTTSTPRFTNVYIYVFVVYNIMHLKSSKYILYMRVKVSNIDSCHRKRWDGARRKTIE